MTDFHQPEELQPPVDISGHYSITAKLRKPSPIKQFYKYFQIPGIGNLAGGLPNNNYFPFDTLEAVAALPDRFKPSSSEPVNEPSDLRAENAGQAGGSRVVVPKVSDHDNVLRKIDVKTALQYGQVQGYPPLYAWLRNFTRDNLHPNVPYKGGPEILLTVGNTDGFSKTAESLMNVWREGQDPIEKKQGMLVEEFYYTSPSVNVKPYGINIVPVGIDEEGMRATGEGGLEDVLENWDNTKGQRPHVLYTVTMGHNPTGALLSVERRKAIYALCVKYDIIIIEDDPYWYLQYPSAISDTERRTLPSNYNTPRSSGYSFLDSLVPSYLSVDYQGRVVRLDTFSKTIAPGCRLGWITAQPTLIDKITMYQQTSTQQPSGFVQCMVAQLLMGPDGALPPERALSSRFGMQPGWKVDGWVRWLEGLRGNYERRMQTMCRILDEGKYLLKTGRRPSLEVALSDLKLSNEAKNQTEQGAAPDSNDSWSLVTSTQLYSFLWPRGGMFIWLRMDMSSHPLASRNASLPTKSFRTHQPPKPNPLAASSHVYSRPQRLPHSTLAQALWVFFTHEPHLVLVSPGAMFSGSPKIAEEKGWQYFRICFAAVDEEEVEDMAQRFVAGVRSFWTLKDVEKVRELARDAPPMLVEAEGMVEGEGF